MFGVFTRKMITKIKKIKTFGVFDNYQVSADMPGFKKYNLIYGWNASGKTTLSRLLRCFELQKMHNDFPQAKFQLQTDNGTISNDNLSQYSNIRVFNKDFIDENVFTQENTIHPIYYLGKEDIEQRKNLEILKNQEKEINIQLNSENQNLEKKKKEKEKLVAEKAKQIKIFLRTAGTDEDEYSNYDKSNFCRKIEKINEEEITQGALNEEELNKKKTAIGQTVKTNIQLLKEWDSFKEEAIEEINKILKTKIVSETIEELKNNKKLNQWVKAGLDLYNQSNKEVCHFCEQPMPENRIEVLKKHFSQDYQNLMTSIGILKKNWESKKINISEPNKNSLYDDLSSCFAKKEEKLKAEIKRYNQFIDKILSQLQKKKENPFKEVEKTDYENFQIEYLIEEINKIISQHNEKTNNFQEIRLKEKKEIEKHFLSEFYEEYQVLKKTISNLEKAVKKMKDKNSEIEKQITQLSQKRKDYKITIQTINTKLQDFLGRKELIFEATNIEHEGYYIKRASTGNFAKSLSEGEKTAVALVYFLSKLNEENFELTNGIVVIDDPISSLDSNSVFQAFGFIKTEVQKAKQIFILTHNFDFFKHIKHWFKSYKDKSEFFMIKNFLSEENKRMAKLSLLDNLLKDYDSEYQYLFSLLYNLCSNESNSLKEAYPFPNVARKFMETFLPFKFPSKKNLDDFFSKAKKETGFNSGKIEKIKRFINAHSHSDIDKMTSWDISQWSEGKQVIQDILDLVKKLDKEHYEGLCQISQK